MRINVPINKSLNGKDCRQPQGRQRVAFCPGIHCGGWRRRRPVEYTFEKTRRVSSPNRAGVCLIPGTDVLIGTGVYTDSVQAEQQRIAALVTESNDRCHVSGLICLGIVALMLLVASGIDFG